MAQTNADHDLLRLVLDRLEQSTLSADAQLAAYAAFEGDDELHQALHGTSRQLPARGTEHTVEAAQPVGAYLEAVTVEGFRGVGPSQTLRIAPGPGLTVVAGRNGSGKSSFAEAIEIALTGDNSRWGGGRGKEWEGGWRNLHHRWPTSVAVQLLVEGAQPARAKVVRNWADTEENVANGAVTVKRAGRPAASLDSLGWAAALDAFRPFLSYTDIGRLLSGRPSEMYDALASILGLEKITEAVNRLTAAQKALKTQRDGIKAELKRLVTLGTELSDQRAARVLAQLALSRPDLDALGRMVVGTEGDIGDDSRARLLTLLATRPPVVDDVLTRARDLRAANEELAGFDGSDAERAGLLADLLTQAIRHQRSHGDVTCPVCGGRELDLAWRRAADRQVAELRETDEALRAAQAQQRRSLESLRGAIPPVPAVLSGEDDLDLSNLPPTRDAWHTLYTLPPDLRLVPDHAEAHVAPFAQAWAALGAEASDALRAREDVWRPFAVQVAAWLPGARAVHASANALTSVSSAIAWLKSVADSLRSERLKPLADQSAEIWASLRQESNVDLGPIRLEGSSTRRRLSLDVTVDGSDASALGVMSQGELHALALSLFLPRASVPSSPFRFLVIDDPVQAMDPAKVDGLARVLGDLAADRQVVVFTHDGRLPDAVRRLSIPAAILQVNRREQSQVAVVKVSDAATRMLDDARALVIDEHVGVAVSRRVVPGFCRMAIEATCVDIIRAKRLEAGDRHDDVDVLLEDHPKLYSRMALALFDDPKRTNDVLPRLQRFGSWAPTTFKACNTGAHEASEGQLDALVHDTERLIKQLAR